MSSFTQATRPIAVSTPLGEDVLLLRSFEGHQAISRLFSFELDMVSENHSINFQDIVGERVTLRVSLADGTARYWNGVVSRFVQAGRDSWLSSYRATVVPWLWFLDQTTDCRIFQKMTAPDIIKQIFGEYKFNDFSLARLYGSFSEREYCVQYRESDFNFVSRLMEEEGIFYFFEHEQAKHTLVLGNAPQAHQSCPHQDKVQYNYSAGGWQDEDLVLQWVQEREYRPGVYTTTDYDFENPSNSLLSSVNGKQGKYEVYDFPGEYLKRQDGNRLVRTRLEEQQMPETIAHGESTCRAFDVGYKFELENHYRADLNQAYILTALHLSGRDSGDYRSGAAGGGSAEPEFRNTFECVPASTPIRPPRRTPTPVVQGCQTAVVVGPASEEIFTDQYGRVKVQFHWDREGHRNENSSCWIRVSYPWSGKGFGGIQIPRIGQEVIVDFIEGDPDRPIITGRVYNAAQMPPWGLPGKRMVSGYKSNSTIGGGGYNELSFDDTKGNELIQVHGQYDMDSKIEHDQRLHVVNDRTKNIDANESTTIGVNRTEKVGSHEDITIGKNRTEKVGINEDITIGANRTEKVLAHEAVNIGLTRTHNVGINDMLNVGAANEVSVGGLQLLTVGLARVKTVGLGELVNIGMSQTTNIGRSHNLQVGKNLEETVMGNHRATVGGGRVTSITKDDTLTVNKGIVINAGEQITLQAGKSTIVLKKDGTILLNGQDLHVQCSGKMNAKATGKMTFKGEKIEHN